MEDHENKTCRQLHTKVINHMNGHKILVTPIHHIGEVHEERNFRGSFIKSQPNLLVVPPGLSNIAFCKALK